MSLFGQHHAFSDVDGAGAVEDAATYLQAAAEAFRAERLEGLNRLDLGAGSAFLDAGCGLGEIVLEAATRVMPGGSAVGIDLSAELIERARAAAGAQRSDAHFEVGDVTCLRFDDHTFDAVRCERVFQHLDDDAATAAVAEFVRVAKPGGRIYLTDAVQSQHVVDCDDAGVFEAILGLVKEHVRDPYSGIRLARRLQTARATVTSFEVIARQVPFASWSRGLGIEQRLAALVASGDVSQERAQAFMGDLAKRDAAGTFYAVGVGCRALAVKDDPTASATSNGAP